MPETRPHNQRIVVVGGGLAAHHSVRALRRDGFAGELLMVSDEAHLPYDRPPLSKAVLNGAREDSFLGLDTEELTIDLRQSCSATALDVSGHRVLVSRGAGESDEEWLGYDRLVIATGTAPVVLPGPGHQHVVRTLDDAWALRSKLIPGARVVIVGAGWIGAEVATAALRAKCRVTCLEYAGSPSAAMGEELGTRFVRWWGDVELRLGVGVAEIGHGVVVLSDQTHVEADIVVTGIGVRPCTTWLEGSGLELDRGVVTDAWLRAGPDIVAIGDVAAWWSPRYQTYMRLGHWDNALTSASVGAASVLRDPTEDDDSNWHDPVPYFWSDQFGHKIQYIGHHEQVDTLVFRGSPGLDGWSAAWLDTTGKLVAILVIDQPRELVAARRLLSEDSFPDPVRLSDPTVPLKEVL